MNRIFSGQTAKYISYPYSKEHSGKKAKKSLGRFSGKPLKMAEDHAKKLIRVARLISLQINRAFPGHAVFAGMFRKACSIILDVNELGAVP